jgi:hypothetical protein
MSQFQEVSSTTPQLPSQLGRGHPLGETSEDEDQHRGAIMSPLEDSPGPSVEDPSTGPAAIVKDRFSIVTMDNEPLARLAAGAV